MSKSTRHAARGSRLVALFALSAAGTVGLIAAAASPASASTHTSHTAASSSTARVYRFATLNDQADPTFNQLLGINGKGRIVGYFGSGADGHPNQGYQLTSPYGQANYHRQNYPGAVQTQVTAINYNGNTAGFWVDAAGANHGFVEWNGVFTSYDAPHSNFTQILGLNNGGTAVGFYTDHAGVNHGFKLNQATGKFTTLNIAGTNTTATAINKYGDITGFTTGGNGQTIGWLLRQGRVSTFVYPSGAVTTPFGINDSDEIVGSYVDGADNTHGFTLTAPLTHAHFATVDDPNGVGSTVVNGLNDSGQLVGFYTDAAGNTDGFLAQ